jgi:NADPH-dependent curcumin reductase CurA
MRGWMNEGKSYIPPVGIGEVMRAGGVGKVVASKNPTSRRRHRQSAAWACRNTACIEAGDQIRAAACAHRPARWAA